MKKTIRIISSLIVLYILPLIVFLACNGNNSDAITPHQENSKDRSSNKTLGIDNVELINETSAEERELSSKTLILTVNSRPVYWPEFCFWLNYIAKFYKKSHGYDEITDWSVKQNGMSLSQFFLSTAVGYARKDRAIEAKAEELGISLSEDDLAEIEENRDNNIRIYGSELEYLRIVASMYMSEDVFNYLTKIDYLGNYLFESLYGARGEKCSDKDFLAHIQEEGYMCAKYIFLSNTDSQDNELSTERLEKKYERMEDILGRLDLSDDPLTLFDTLMKEYSEDKKALEYPDGRVFIPGVMAKAFESAYLELKANKYSGIVKADDGYYIILRMPISPDMMADSTGNTLRYRVAYQLFKDQVEKWSEETKIEYEDGYYRIDVKELF